MSASEPSRPFSVCVFCGARPGSEPRFLEIARRAGALLAASGATVVYGGGSVGATGQHERLLQAVGGVAVRGPRPESGGGRRASEHRRCGHGADRIVEARDLAQAVGHGGDGFRGQRQAIDRS